MNILIIDNSIAFTGAFKCALNEAELLSGRHNFVFVLSEKSTLTSNLSEKGFTVYTLPLLEIRKSIPALLMYPFVLFRNAIRLKRMLQKERIDVVQVNDFYNMLGVAVKMLGFKGKLITYVRFLPSVMPATLRNIWIKLGFKYSHRVIAVSDAVLRQLPKHAKAVQIYDPVQLSESLPEKTYAQGGPLEILYLSNYIQGKGQDSAIEAFAKVYNTNKNLRLKFSGGDMGLAKNAEYRKKLEQKVRELGLSGEVNFAAFSTDIERTIKQADIMLNFSEAESFSMTCLEAAYYGTPLIATRCGGPEEIIDNGITGITVPVKDIEAMSTALLTMAENAELRRAYAIAGKEYVRNKFKIDNYITAMEGVLAG